MTTMTYEEWFRWVDEGRWAEWVNGKVVKLETPNLRHQRVRGWLAAILTFYVEHKRIGTVLFAPFEMKLDVVPSSRMPDIVVLLATSAGRLDDQRLNGAADLAIEILSDESVTRDRRDKFAEYAMAGVSEYWIIDPRLGRYSFQAYQLTDEDYFVEIAPDDNGKLHSSVLPDFIIDPAWISDKPLLKLMETFLSLAPAAFIQHDVHSVPPVRAMA
jgi:Uma2 family endonuclease